MLSSSSHCTHGYNNTTIYIIKEKNKIFLKIVLLTVPYTHLFQIDSPGRAKDFLFCFFNCSQVTCYHSSWGNFIFHLLFHWGITRYKHNAKTVCTKLGTCNITQWQNSLEQKTFSFIAPHSVRSACLDFCLWYIFILHLFLYFSVTFWPYSWI